ncbi:MAG TPA: hypothetical protein VMD75_06195 [Candidatus Binataceae bacterium]|nr:hypothetical protein [Candidatus Binataceae bacterium]
MKPTPTNLDLAASASPRPSGIVRIRVDLDGRLIATLEAHNLFVNAGLPALAALIAGDTTGQFASAVGFGSGSVAPTLGDTALTTPAYYKTLDSHAENGSSPGPGAVQFNWSMTSADTGALGIIIQEIGLFANPSSVALPGSSAPTLLLARKTIAPITFSTGMSLSGTWTLTF